MQGVTDIPDWVFAQAGVPFDPRDVPTTSSKLLQSLNEKSPSRFVGKIKCPVLVHVGDDDLRVPPSQSYSLYYALKARGVPVE
jgi:dipeptidyl aminopeptidase/acylaminoacyl peptidase